MGLLNINHAYAFGDFTYYSATCQGCGGQYSGMDTSPNRIRIGKDTKVGEITTLPCVTCGDEKHVINYRAESSEIEARLKAKHEAERKAVEEEYDKRV